MYIYIYIYIYIKCYNYLFLVQVTESKNEGRSAVWLHIPVKHSALVSEVVISGFTLHHAYNNEIVLYKWLDDTRQNKIPHFASHQVGVCGKIVCILTVWMT